METFIVNTSERLELLIKRADIYSLHIVHELQDLSENGCLNDTTEHLLLEVSGMFDDIAASLISLQADREREAEQDIAEIIQKERAGLPA